MKYNTSFTGNLLEWKMLKYIWKRSNVRYAFFIELLEVVLSNFNIIPV